MNPSTALARTLVDELARCGLTDAVLAPGSRSTALALALHDDPRIRLHIQIDERSAAFLALGIAKTSRRPVAVVCTSGSAAANFHPAVIEAAQAGVALLVLTADRPPELRDTGANQTIDQIKLYGSAVRWFCEVGVPELFAGAGPYWRSVASRAFATACGGPAGPVHLNLAFREPLVPHAADDVEPLPGRADGRAYTHAKTPPMPPAAFDVAWLADRVAATPRGVLVLGDTDADARPLLGLAHAAGWPVFAEPMSCGRTGPDAISTYDLLCGVEGFAAAHRPELVVTVGRIGLSKSLLEWLGREVEHVVLDTHGAWLDPNRSAGRIVVGDPAMVADLVTERVNAREKRPWLDAWVAAERAVRAAVDAHLDALGEPNEPRTARDLAATLPDGALLFAASSMPVRDLNSFMRPRSGLRVAANRGASGIDGFVSTALGAAIAHDAPVAALAGDLSLLHDANGLLLADRDVHDLVIVAVHNDGGGIFSFLPQAAFSASFEAVFGTPHGRRIEHLAHLHGCGWHPLARADDLPDMVAGAFAAGGVHIVEVRTERTANAALHRQLRAVAEASLR